jgi:hypothetical protein
MMERELMDMRRMKRRIKRSCVLREKPRKTDLTFVRRLMA